MQNEVQMPWWGLIFGGLIFVVGYAAMFTLPISNITATTNQTPRLNIITKYLIDLILPGRPVANVIFKTYSYMSMMHVVSFLNSFSRSFFSL